MWPMIDGFRVLKGSERDLICHAVGEMSQRLDREFQGSSRQHCYGIDWFDQWDVDQRIWLLEEVTSALLIQQRPPPTPAAMFEATVDAIFCHILESIEQEIHSLWDRSNHLFWRSEVIAAFRCQHNRWPDVNAESTKAQRWRVVASQITETILGHSSYLQAEQLRDSDPGILHHYLQQRGLPEDYLRRLAPLRHDAQTRQSLAQLERLINSGNP